MSDALGQHSDLRLLALLAPHLHSQIFVDIGAEKGVMAECLFSCGLSGYLFEPLPKHAEYLAELARRNGSYFYANAISDIDDKCELNIAVNEHGEVLDYYHSLIPMPPHTNFRHEKRISVQCRRIDSLVQEGVLPDKIGILKTDTEGNDYFVLTGLGVLRPEVIVCEFFSEGIYEGWEHSRPELLIELMKKLGYRRYLVIKRWKFFELTLSGPTSFNAGDWGNLFFFDDIFFEVAESTITTFISECNQTFVGGLENILKDRETKEIVIQQLLAEKRFVANRKANFETLLRKFCRWVR